MVLMNDRMLSTYGKSDIHRILAPPAIHWDEQSSRERGLPLHVFIKYDSCFRLFPHRIQIVDLYYMYPAKSSSNLVHKAALVDNLDLHDHSAGASSVLVFSCRCVNTQ